MHRIGLYVFIGAYIFSSIVLVLGSIAIRYQVGVLVLLSLVLCIFAQRDLPKRYVALIGLGCLLAAARVASIPESMPTAFLPLIDHKSEVEGTIVSMPDIRETSARITLQVQEGGETTRIIAAVPLYPVPFVGDVVRVSGTIKRPESFDTDGGRVFAYADFLRKDGIFGVMGRASVIYITESKNPYLLFLRNLQHIKNGFIRSVELAIPDPASALAVGIIVGGKQGLGESLIEAFERAGMLQIVVLSGYNVMIVASMIMQALSGLPKRIAIALACGSIACFVLIAGAGSSALRAGIMACFAIYARGTKNMYDVLRVLAVTLLILGLWNPLIIAYDPGFQFSFIATLGLILAVPSLERRLLWMRNAFLIEAFATTLAAEIFLLPFLLWQTGNLSVVSVFANIAAMPVIPFCMAASVVAAVVSVPLHVVGMTLATVVGLPAYLALTYVLQVATVSASLPFASYVVPIFSFWIVIVSYAVIGALLFLDSKRHSRMRASAF